MADATTASLSPNALRIAERLAQRAQTREDTSVLQSDEQIVAEAIQYRPRLAQAWAALVAFRRCVAAVRAAVNREVASLPPSAAALVADVVGGGADLQSREPVGHGDVIYGLQAGLGFLAEEFEVAARAQEAEDAVPKPVSGEKPPVPIGVEHASRILQDDPEVLVRRQSLVVVGPRAGLRALALRACRPAAAAGHLVAVLDDAPPSLLGPDGIPIGDATPELQVGAQVAVLGLRLWKGRFASRDAASAYAREYFEATSRGADLVICLDLGVAFRDTYESRAGPRRAGDGHRWLRHFADAAGAALLGLLPVDDGRSPDFTSSAYEQLRTFAVLAEVVPRPDGSWGLLPMGNDPSECGFPIDEPDCDYLGRPR